MPPSLRHDDAVKRLDQDTGAEIVHGAIKHGLQTQSVGLIVLRGLHPAEIHQSWQDVEVGAELINVAAARQFSALASE